MGNGHKMNETCWIRDHPGAIFEKKIMKMILKINRVQKTQENRKDQKRDESAEDFGNYLFTIKRKEIKCTYLLTKKPKGIPYFAPRRTKRMS